MGSDKSRSIHRGEAFALLEVFVDAAHEVGVLRCVELVDVVLAVQVQLGQVDIIITGIGDDLEIVTFVSGIGIAAPLS